MSKVNELLKTLELKGALMAWEALNQNPQSLLEMPIDDVMELLLTSEQNERDNRRQASLLKVSKLPEKVSLSDVIFDPKRGADFTKIFNAMSTLDFVRNGHNLCIFGGSGTGKTFLACLLGTIACRRGISTKFYTTKDLLNSMLLTKGSSMYQSKRTFLKRLGLLIIDDFCLTTDFTSAELEILFEILNDRYRFKSVIVTSQKTPEQWIKDLGGSTIAEAIVE
ncbi:MAG: ATP-binding protein, partial [Succinivibrio sp.]